MTVAVQPRFGKELVPAISRHWGLDRRVLQVWKAHRIGLRVTTMDNLVDLIACNWAVVRYCEEHQLPQIDVHVRAAIHYLAGQGDIILPKLVEKPLRKPNLAPCEQTPLSFPAQLIQAPQRLAISA